MRRRLSAICAALGFFLLGPLPARPGICAEPASYVGSQVCAGCHPDEHATFLKYSKKAHSSKSLRLMAKGLDQEEMAGCFGCHTTGYGRPGGFVSFEKTPELADAGCEVCHGPGSAHIASGGDPARITAKPTMTLCETCHNSKRVQDFNFKPMLFAGAH